MHPPVTYAQMITLLDKVTLTRLSRGCSTRTDTDLRVPRQYSDFEVQGLIRALVVPYLIPIKSERQLAYELQEKAELRKFLFGSRADVPSRATFWHFRKRNFKLYRQLIVRALAIMHIEAESLNISLPCASAKPSSLVSKLEGPADKFFDQATGLNVELFYDIPLESRESNQLSLFVGEGPNQSEASVRNRTFLPNEIGFPVVLRATKSRVVIEVELNAPEWLNHPYSHVDVGDLFPSRNKVDERVYCQAIVLRDGKDGKEVLLSRRLEKKGKGEYDLPGGGMEEQDRGSVRACIARELKEETGLKYIDGVPIFARRTEKAGLGKGKTVGVYVTNWRGKVHPSNREHLAQEPWEWFPLNRLPDPMFFFARIVLHEFKNQNTSGLKWSDVEELDELPLFDQTNEYA